MKTTTKTPKLTKTQALQAQLDKANLDRGVFLARVNVLEKESQETKLYMEGLKKVMKEGQAMRDSLSVNLDKQLAENKAMAQYLDRLRAERKTPRVGIQRIEGDGTYYYTVKLAGGDAELSVMGALHRLIGDLVVAPGAVCDSDGTPPTGQEQSRRVKRIAAWLNDRAQAIPE